VGGGVREQVDLALAVLLLEGARLRGQVVGQGADLAVVHVEEDGLAEGGGQGAHEGRVVVVGGGGGGGGGGGCGGGQGG